MKNFKKTIFLWIFVVMIFIYLIYNYFNENVDDFIEEELYIETNTNIEKINKIILHITGEVEKPRAYRG